MKSISKAMIAVMIAAAMCVVPLFVIEDAEAATLDEKGAAATFKADSVSDTDINKLISDGMKNQWVQQILTMMGTNLTGYDEFSNPHNLYEISTITITDAKNIEMSVGGNVTDSAVTNVDATSLQFKIRFTATRLFEEGPLFNGLDGMQKLFNNLDYANTIPVGATLDFEGTVTMSDSDFNEVKITKNAEGNYVPTKETEDGSKLFKYSGNVKYTYTYDEKPVVKEIELTMESKSSAKTVTTYDFGDVAADKVVADTKLTAEKKFDGGGVKYTLDYKLGDVSGSAGYAVAQTSDAYAYIMMSMGQILAYMGQTMDIDIVVPMVGADIIMTGTITPGNYYFYGDSDSRSLFTPSMVNPASTDIRTNDGMKTFLTNAGATTTEYSTAESINDSAAISVDVGGGSGGSNIIFYVIIGVLAVAVVALAVLLIKKK